MANINTNNIKKCFVKKRRRKSKINNLYKGKRLYETAKYSQMPNNEVANKTMEVNKDEQK